MNNEKKAPVRQIIFRGLRADSKGWVYGDVSIQFEGGNRCFISVWEKRKGDHGKHYWSHIGYEVIPETVGQFTGLLDKNGKEIYEGDYVSYLGAIGIVCYESDTAMFMVRFEVSRSLWSFNSMDGVIEVISNIHEKSDINSIEGKETKGNG